MIAVMSNFIIPRVYKNEYVQITKGWEQMFQPVIKVDKKNVS